jgi:hypothetical protein
MEYSGITRGMITRRAKIDVSQDQDINLSITLEVIGSRWYTSCMKILRAAVNCIATVLVASLLSSVSGQTQAGGSVEGQVLNLKTGAPVKGVTVHLLGPYKLPLPIPAPNPPAPMATIQVDDQGRFAFTHVAAGAYTLRTERSGFSRGALGSEMGEMVNVRSEPIKGLVVRMAPLSVITGTVVDENGTALQDAAVSQLVWVNYPGGRLDIGSLHTVRTDDRGIYRLIDVMRGAYTVAVSPPIGALSSKGATGYAVTYNGNVADASEAATIATEMAETRRIDFQLKKTPVARIRGRLIGPDGLGKGPGVLTLAPAKMQVIGGMLAGVVTVNGADGNFEISGVPPGAYRLSAAASDGPRRLAAVQVLDVRADMDGVRIQLGSTVQVRGTVKVLGQKAVSAQGMNVDLEPLEIIRDASRSRVTGNNDFEISGAWRLHYAVHVASVPADCYLDSVQYGGKEVAAEGIVPSPDTPLVVTLSTAEGARLDVRVAGNTEDPPMCQRVTMIPLDGPAMTARTAAADPQGNVIFRNIRPGKYIVTAWDRTCQVAFSTQALGPESLKPLEARSKIITLEASGKQSVELTPVTLAERQKAFAGR